MLKFIKDFISLKEKDPENVFCVVEPGELHEHGSLQCCVCHAKRKLDCCDNSCGFGTCDDCALS